MLFNIILNFHNDWSLFTKFKAYKLNKSIEIALETNILPFVPDDIAMEDSVN